jgi:recombination DNA repair RAD52 pathway protein
MEDIREMVAGVSLKKVREVVEKPLKTDWIKKRELGGRKLDYIEGGRVKKILNEAFDYQWSWEILKWEFISSYDKVFKNRQTGQETATKQPPYVLVWGKLTVPGLGSREAFGSKVIQFAEGADQQCQALKSASTDALKVAASNFGVALELYVDDDEEEAAEKAEARGMEGPRGNVANQYQNATPQQSATSKMKSWNKEDLELLKSLREQLGFGGNSPEEREKLNPLVEDFSKGLLKSYKEITPENIKAFNQYLTDKVNGK